MGKALSIPNYRLQHQILSQHLFKPTQLTNEVLGVLNEIAGVCLREIYQICHGNHSDIAKREWNAKLTESDFQVLRAAFRSFDRRVAHPTVKQRWDLSYYYFTMRIEKLKEGRLALWRELASTINLRLSRNIELSTGLQVADAFQTFLQKHNRFSQLREMRLGGLRFNSHILPPEIGQLRFLKSLDISCNPSIGITTFSPEIFHLTFLEILQINFHNFTELPPEIGQLKSLKHLSLFTEKQRGLRRLPAEIGQLTKLETLEIVNHCLQALPLELFQLSSLRKLQIAQGSRFGYWRKTFGLATLAPQIAQLKKLRDLDLQGNSLTKIPSEIGQLPKLKRLNLSRNQLQVFPSGVCDIKSLRVLILQNNALTSLPSQLGNFLFRGYHLKFLDVKKNPIPEERLRAITKLLRRAEIRVKFMPAACALVTREMQELRKSEFEALKRAEIADNFEDVLTELTKVSVSRGLS